MSKIQKISIYEEESFAQSADDAAELENTWHKIIRVLKKTWIILLVAAAAVMAGYLGLQKAILKPEYQSQATILVTPQIELMDETNTSFATLYNKQTENIKALFNNGDVLKRIDEQDPAEDVAKTLSAESLTGSDLITITGTAPTADLATKLVSDSVEYLTSSWGTELPLVNIGIVSEPTAGTVTNSTKTSTLLIQGFIIAFVLDFVLFLIFMAVNSKNRTAYDVAAITGAPVVMVVNREGK